MKKTLFLAAAVFVASLPTNAQVLLYQWAFTNSADTFTNSAASYAWTPGTGNLRMLNISGNVFTAGTGSDGINPLLYFTNSSTGPGAGLGVDAKGALVANGQGYNGGNSAVTIATNLNLGTLNQITVTFWVQMGSGVTGQFPRFVQFGQNSTYDIGNKGSGAHNDIGASINFASSAIQEQNTVANASSAQSTATSVTGLSNFPSGLPADGSTWIFEGITYNGTQAANQFVTWLGTAALSVQSIALPANFGNITLTTNATVIIGGDAVAGTARGLSTGAIADVRIYSGVLTSNMLENVRKFLPDGAIPPGAVPAYFTSSGQPSSGINFVGGSRTFAVTPSGNPPNTPGFTYSYLWRSNSVAVSGGTNANLSLNSLTATANGASFVCSVTNFFGNTVIGGTNSVAATLSIITPVPGSYAKAVYTNNPYSFWLVNELTNSTSFTVYDYVNGNDGMELDPANTLFVSGPQSSYYPGFSATNTAIRTQHNFIASRLNMADPVNFPNTGMTICGWVNTPIAATANGLIFDLVSDTAGGYGLTFNGANTVSYQWGQNPPSSGFTVGVPFNTNEWTFVALVVSTNLTANDIASSITADTNVTVYVGAPSIGLNSAVDSTALNSDLIGGGISAGVLALGRTASAASDNGSFYAENAVAFNGVAVFYSALSAQVITNLYLTGAGIHLFGTPDPNTVGNLLLSYPMGTLQEATSVTGPYTDVSGMPASPNSVPMTDPQHYFRLRQ